MIKKIGIAAILGVSVLALAACSQQSGKEKTDSVTAKIQKASDAATQKVKDAGSATANAIDKAGDKLKDASKYLTGTTDDSSKATATPDASKMMVPKAPTTTTGQ